jgi:hypothetical protein
VAALKDGSYYWVKFKDRHSDNEWTVGRWDKNTDDDYGVFDIVGSDEPFWAESYSKPSICNYVEIEEVGEEIIR